MSVAVLRLGLIEVAKSFRIHPPPATGVRDFGWLTLFYGLVTALLSLMLIAGQNLPVRMNQTMLGALGEGPIPVRVRDSFARDEGIDQKALHEFATAGVAGAVIYPQARVELDAAQMILAGYSRGAARHDPESMPWKGTLNAMALPLDAPFWRWALDRAPEDFGEIGPFGTVIVASRSRFEAQFEYAGYRNAILADIAGGPLRRFLTDRYARPDDLDHLILRVKERTRDGATEARLQPFSILWVDGLPLTETTAIVFPLSTAELIHEAWSRPAARLVMDAGGRPARRIADITINTLRLDAAAKAEARAALAKLAACLGAGGNEGYPSLTEDGNRLRARLPGGEAHPLRRDDVAHCAGEAGLPNDFPEGPAFGGQMVVGWTEPIGFDYAYAGHGQISAPCAVRNETDRAVARTLEAMTARAHGTRACAEGGEGALGLIFTDRYNDATIYLDAGRSLDAAVADIENWTAWSGNGPAPADRAAQAGPDGTPGRWTKVFRLDETYAKSLERYGVLRTILDSLSWPAMTLFLVLAAALCFIKQHTAFAHRRPQYGFLALCGVSGRALGWMAMFQSALSACLGALAGVGTACGLLWGMNTVYWHGAPRADAYRTLGFDQPDLLAYPNSLLLGAIVLAMTLVAVALAFIAMHSLGILRARSPMDVFKLRHAGDERAGT